MHKNGYYLKSCSTIYRFKIKSKSHFNQNTLFLEHEKLTLYSDATV